MGGGKEGEREGKGREGRREGGKREGGRERGKLLEYFGVMILSYWWSEVARNLL